LLGVDGLLGIVGHGFLRCCFHGEVAA
jgi:hypothetical protein